MRERIFIVATILLAIFLAKFPTLFHFLNTPQGYWPPRQISWFDAWDINSYVSYIRYGERVGMLLTNTYTTLSHPPLFIFQFYTLTGVINRIFHFDPFLMFHFSSILMSVLLILTCYLVAKTFIEDHVARISAFIVMVLGGGLGFLPFFGISADTQLAGFTLINAFERGHDALSTSLFLISMVFLYRFYVHSRKKDVIISFTSAFFQVLIHPPFALLYVIVSSVFAILRFIDGRKYSSFLIPFGYGIPILLAYFGYLHSYSVNPGFSNLGWTPANLANILSITVGFGLWSFFIFWSIVKGKQEKNETIIRLFLIVQLFVLFLPYSFTLYYAKGLHVWGIVAGIYGLTELFQNKKIQSVVLIILVGLSLFSRLYIFRNLMNAPIDNSFYFLTINEGNMIERLQKLPPDSTVLSLYRVGNYIPAFTDSKVYYGHRFQTPNSAVALQNAFNFYTIWNEAQQKEFLEKNNIDYIYYGLEEQSLRNERALPIDNPFPYTSVVLTNDDIALYATGLGHK